MKNSFTCRSKSPATSAVGSTREGGHLGSYSGSVGGPLDASPGQSYQGQPGSYPQGGPGSDGDHLNRNMVSVNERYISCIAISGLYLYFKHILILFMNSLLGSNNCFDSVFGF